MRPQTAFGDRRAGVPHLIGGVLEAPETDHGGHRLTEAVERHPVEPGPFPGAPPLPVNGGLLPQRTDRTAEHDVVVVGFDHGELACQEHPDDELRQ